MSRVRRAVAAMSPPALPSNNARNRPISAAKVAPILLPPLLSLMSSAFAEPTPLPRNLFRISRLRSARARRRAARAQTARAARRRLARRVAVTCVTAGGGIPLHKLHLFDCRLPQEPSIFSGSIQYNVDPLGEFDEAKETDEGFKSMVQKKMATSLWRTVTDDRLPSATQR